MCTNDILVLRTSQLVVFTSVIIHFFVMNLRWLYTPPEYHKKLKIIFMQGCSMIITYKRIITEL